MDGCAKVTRTAAGKGLARRPLGPVLRAYAPNPLGLVGKTAGMPGLVRSAAFPEATSIQQTREAVPRPGCPLSCL